MRKTDRKQTLTATLPSKVKKSGRRRILKIGRLPRLKLPRSISEINVKKLNSLKCLKQRHVYITRLKLKKIKKVLLLSQHVAIMSTCS